MSGDRWALAIEVSNPSAAGTAGAAGRDGGPGPGVAAGVARGGGVEPLGVERLSSASRHDEDLMPAIDRLARRLGLAPAALGRVIVSAGPGGFSGLRVAVATAKALSLATGASACAVPTALVAGERLRAERGLEGPWPCAVLLASKKVGPRPSAWCSVVSPEDGGVVGERVSGVVDAPGLAAALGESGARSVMADAALPDELASAAAGRERLPLAVDAGSCLRAGWPMAGVTAAALEPLYGREPEAVRRWREVHGS